MKLHILQFIIFLTTPKIYIVLIKKFLKRNFASNESLKTLSQYYVTFRHINVVCRYITTSGGTYIRGNAEIISEAYRRILDEHDYIISGAVITLSRAPKKWARYATQQ